MLAPSMRCYIPQVHKVVALTVVVHLVAMAGLVAMEELADIF